MRKNTALLLITVLIIASCHSKIVKQLHEISGRDSSVNSYGNDRDFLGKHQAIVELANGNSRVLIVPGYQARVMTSTCEGDSGYSFGWINYALINSGKYMPHINAYGGEERFWMGPEGGQYALFFKPGDPFDLKHWQTPAIIDTAGFDLLKKDFTTASFTRSFDIENYAGTVFQVRVDRRIKLLSTSDAVAVLNTPLPGVSLVGYQTTNTITNAGKNAWLKPQGVPSIWLSSMLKASPQNTVMIPFRNGGASKINSTYFGKVPAERLIKKDSILFFKTDAKYRSKIGVPPSIVKRLLGDYDASGNVLTIIKFDYNGDSDYVNSTWEHQQFPYKGDVVNSYNDGPNDLGSQLGTFYEMETSSPAIALRKNQSLTHTQYIFHFQGSKNELNEVAKRLLGVSLDEGNFK